MGKFFTSISLKTEDRRPIIKYLRSAQRDAWVSPVKDGFVCVFDQRCDERNIDEISQLGTTLTKQLQCPAIAIIKHEYSLVWYQFFDGGQMVDESKSASDIVENIGSLPPQPEETSMACKAFGIRVHQSELKAIKTSEELVDLINLPVIANCLGFTYLERDEFELEFDDLADEELDISLEEADRYNTLEKLGWTKTAKAAGERCDSRTPRKEDQVLYWPGFAAGALPRDEQDAEAFLSNGTERLAKHDLKAAVDYFDRVLKLKGDFPQAYYARHNRALARAQLGDIQGAIDDLLVAVKLHSDCDGTKDLLTRLLRTE